MNTTSFVVYPEDINALGLNMIHGGKMLKEMDRFAAVLVKRCIRDAYQNSDLVNEKYIEYSNIPHGYETELYSVTVGVEKVSFQAPAYLGDVVHLSGNVFSPGKTSLKVKITAQAERMNTGQIIQMGSGVFIFCVMYNGQPFRHGIIL